MSQFDKWLVDNQHIREGTSIFTFPINQNAPDFIIAWIMSLYVSFRLSSDIPSQIHLNCRCDIQNPDGSFKASTEYTCTLSHALKMRSSTTYGFSRDLRVADNKWTQAVTNGAWAGNPSLSCKVTRYMISLKRRKVVLFRLTRRLLSDFHLG